MPGVTLAPSSPSGCLQPASPRGPPSNRRLREKAAARDAAADKRKEASYWSDESYAQFYASSAEEQRMMLGSSVGLSQGEAGRASKNWLVRGEAKQGSRNSAPGPRPLEARGGPSQRQTAEFQAAFAARSVGRGFVTAGACQGLLKDMGLNVPPAAVAQLVAEATGSEDGGGGLGGSELRNFGELRGPEARDRRLPYEMALQVYQLALLPEVVQGAIAEAVADFVGEALSFHEADTVVLDRGDTRAPPSPLLGDSRKNASVFKRAGQYSLSPRGGQL